MSVQTRFLLCLKVELEISISDKKLILVNFDLIYFRSKKRRFIVVKEWKRFVVRKLNIYPFLRRHKATMENYFHPKSFIQ